MVENRRKDLVTRIKKQMNFLKDRKVNFPETLELVTGAKGNLFEMGGSDHESGIAVIVAAPSGKPSFSRVLHRRWPNEMHAAISIWPGCLVAMGSHYMGKESMAIYSVQELKPGASDKDHGTVTLKRLAYRTSFASTGASPATWYEVDPVIPGVYELVEALKIKLYTYNCTEPVYIEWLHSIKNFEKASLTELVKSARGKCDEYGIGDTTVKSDGICVAFDQFMETIKAVADDLNENLKKSFVWVQFGFSLKDDKLICQARHLTNNDGSAWPVQCHEVLYQFSTNDTDEIIAYMDKFNPAYTNVIFGVPYIDILINKISNTGTVINFAKYAKCTAHQTPINTNGAQGNVVPAPVEMTDEEITLTSDADRERAYAATEVDCTLCETEIVTESAPSATV
jgi:hypothetical protein